MNQSSALFPKLAFACPKLWTEMHGDEHARFCDVCGLHVHNLSVLSADERASLLRPNAGRLCVSYQRRLNGEFVTPENPLTGRERTGLRQVGAAALTAAAFALAAGCVTKPEAIVPPPPVSAIPVTPVPNEKQETSPDDEETILLTGFIVEASEDAGAYRAAPTLAGHRHKGP